MRTETKLFALLVAFFAPVAVIYGFFTHWREPVGVVGLLLASGLAALIAFFMYWTGRKVDERPEDNPEGEIADADGDYGFFSPYSWWPMALGAAAAVVFLGLAVGWWLMIIGIPLLLLSAVGWVFEYFHGEHAL